MCSPRRGHVLPCSFPMHIAMLRLHGRSLPIIYNNQHLSDLHCQAMQVLWCTSPLIH